MYTAKELMGCTVTWVSTSSTWKIIGLHSAGQFQLQKLYGFGVGSPPGRQVPYSIKMLIEGIEKGSIEIIETTNTFEIET